MYLFVDTETTGLPKNRDAPASNTRNWPRIVQIAWILTDLDGREVRSEDHIIRPDRFKIPKPSQRIHGISTERALRDGVRILPVLSRLANDLKRATILVAHNVAFDQGVVGAEFIRAGWKNNPLDWLTHCCTMESSTDYCQLPSDFSDFKWPTLQELHCELFGSRFESAHNAAVDVRVCMECFFELLRLGIIDRAAVRDPEPIFDGSIDCRPIPTPSEVAKIHASIKMTSRPYPVRPNLKVSLSSSLDAHSQVEISEVAASRWETDFLLKLAKSICSGVAAILNWLLSAKQDIFAENQLAGDFRSTFALMTKLLVIVTLLIAFILLLIEFVLYLV